MFWPVRSRVDNQCWSKAFSQIVFAVRVETDCIDRESEVRVCPGGLQTDVPFLRVTTVPAGVD